jgi:hypothetical protein
LAGNVEASDAVPVSSLVVDAVAFVSLMFIAGGCSIVGEGVTVLVVSLVVDAVAFV